MRQYIIASILIILGLVAISYKVSLSKDSFLLPYLNDVSSALLVGGVLSLLFRIFQDKATESTLRRLMRIHDSVDELGLTEIMPEVQAYNFTGLIQNADRLVVVMNDGLRWVGNNSVALQDRFSKKSTTEFFFVDPESPFVTTLAQKTATSEADLKKKIHDTCKRVEEAFEKSTKLGSLTIYFLKTFPTKAMFFSEDFLVETPYQTASGRARIPVFIYRKVERQDSPYAFAERDIDAARDESSRHFHQPGS